MPPAGDVDATYIPPGLGGADQTTIGSHLESDTPAPRRIGPYAVIRPLGEGGMGSVFLAEQTDPVRLRVALKVIKTDTPSREVLQRFEAERRALAVMDHPHIATVLDAGLTEEGLPYFAMELVKGVPITQFCDDRQLSPEERLDLFVQTCRAIQHAHTKGIVHRDIKPSNVLVTESDGEASVKVIDFGLAKVLDGDQPTDHTVFTSYGQVVGTLAYMSPEQAEMTDPDVDARTDVYSLGVVLFELLTGSTPITRDRIRGEAFDRVLALIREEEVVRPSVRLSRSADALRIAESRRTDPKRLSGILRGDLDWVVGKAVEKDPARRYDTPAALADDVQRYLNGEAVQARPPSVSYRFQKSLRRNKGAWSAGATILLLLVGGLIGTGTMWGRARAAEADAVAEKDRAIAATGEAVKEAARASRAEEQAKQSAAAEAEAAAAERAARGRLEIERKAARDAEAAATFQLATARWRERRPGDALRLLYSMPAEYREAFEWRYAARRYAGGATVLRGHERKVVGVAVAPRGGRVASRDWGGGVRVWDADTGRTLADFRTPAEAGCDLVFSPDGARLASGGSDGVLRIWKADGGEELASLRGHSGHAMGLAFSPDGRRLASAGVDRTVRLWDARTGEQTALLLWHPEPVETVAFGPRGGRVVSAGWDGVLRLWDAETGEETAALKGHTDRVESVAFSPDGGRIASAGLDGSVRVWDAETGAESAALRGQEGAALAVAFSPDGTRLAAGGEDGVVRVWAVSGGDPVAELPGHADAVFAVAFGGSGTRLVSGGADRTVRVWDLAADEPLGLGGEGLTALAFSGDGTRLAAGGRDGTVRVWDASGAPLPDPPPHGRPVRGLAFTADGVRAAFGRWDAGGGTDFGAVLGAGLPAEFGAGSNGGAWAEALGPGGLTASGMLDGTVRVRGAGGGERSAVRPTRASVTALAFSPDGGRLASGGSEGSLRILSLDGDELAAPNGHSAAVSGVAFSPDGGRLVSASRDATVRLWDAAGGEELATLRGHTGAVTSAAFAPGGGRIASAGWDRTVRLWNAGGGREVLVLEGHADRVVALSFAAGGEALATGGRDGRVRIWNAPRVARETLLVPGASELTAVGIAEDEAAVVAVDAAGRKLAWDPRTGGRLAEGAVPDAVTRDYAAESGRWRAFNLGDRVVLVDRAYADGPAAAAERRSREAAAARWHRRRLQEAGAAGDDFAAALHAAALLSLEPDDPAWAAALRTHLGNLGDALVPRSAREAASRPSEDAARGE